MINRKHLQQILVAGAVFFAFSGLFFALRPYAIPGGDSEEVCLFASSPQFMFYFRSPLVVFLHQLLYKLLNPAGWSAKETIALGSSIAGGLYVVALTHISSNLSFLLFNLLSPFIFIFVSHVEHYAWVNMCLTWFIYYIYRFLNQRSSLIPATICFVLASAFHNLALFYLPALFVVAFTVKRQNHRLKIDWHPFLTLKQIKVVLLIFTGYFLLMSILPLIFSTSVRGLDVGKERLCPLFHNPNPVRFYFTMFQWEHFAMMLYFIKMSSPAGLPVIIILAPWLLRGRFYFFLLIMTLCGLGWAFLWHPDMGYPDWDLFGSFAIPANILAGLMLRDLLKKFKRSWQKT